MQLSTDERHAETLAFLAHVRDYLASWPAHPMNRGMLAKIDAHLENPLHRLVRDGQKTRSGANFTPAGVEVLRATLEGDRLSSRGQKMATLGNDPRLAAMLVSANNDNEVATAAKLAAILEEPPRGGSTDLAVAFSRNQPPGSSAVNNY